MPDGWEAITRTWYPDTQFKKNCGSGVESTEQYIIPGSEACTSFPDERLGFYIPNRFYYHA